MRGFPYNRNLLHIWISLLFDLGDDLASYGEQGQMAWQSLRTRKFGVCKCQYWSLERLWVGADYEDW